MAVWRTTATAATRSPDRAVGEARSKSYRAHTANNSPPNQLAQSTVAWPILLPMVRRAAGDVSAAIAAVDPLPYVASDRAADGRHHLGGLTAYLPKKGVKVLEARNTRVSGRVRRTT